MTETSEGSAALTPPTWRRGWISGNTASRQPVSIYQGLAAYRLSLAGKAVLVRDPGSPFFGYLKPP